MKLAAMLVCLAAVSQPLRIEQGATWSKDFDSSLDLTDCTLGMEIRDRSGGTLLAAPTLTETSLAAGTFTASLTANQTGQLVFRSAVYDVEATCGVTVHRLFEGSVSLALGVTTDEVAPGEFPVPGTPPGEVYLRTADAATTYVPLTDDFAEGSSDTEIVRRTNTGSGHAAFIWDQGGGTFASTWDPVWCWGYNYDCSGLLVQAGEPAVGWFQEADYELAGTHYMEEYFQWKLADGTTTGRPVFAQTDRATGDTAVVLEAFGSLGYISLNAGLDGTTQVAKVVTSGIQFPTGKLQWTASGSKNLMSAVNVAGTQTVDALRVDGNNDLRVGGGSGVVFRQVMAEIPIRPQQVTGTTPSISTTCSSTTAGAIVYVDDTDDTAVSHLCFCGTAADDSTYGWRRADAPATACP